MEWANGKTSSLPIEMANFLAPGRTYKDKKVQSESVHERMVATILQLDHIDKSSLHYRYVYQTDKGMMSFSAFELARTLFFHNSHLVRAVYSPSGINDLAFVDRSSIPIKITLPDSTSYPVSSLTTKQSRTHFAWLLTTNDAKKSAFTIYQTLKENQDDISFKFKPPELSGWQFAVAVSKDTIKGHAEVQRIETIVEAYVEEKLVGIKIHHPKKKFKVESSSTKTNKRGKTPDVDLEPSLDMGELVGFGTRLYKQRTKGFSFNASRIQGATLSDGKEKPASVPLPSDSEGVVPEKAGVGLPEREGTAQEFDPVINQVDDPIEEAIDLPQKFLIFEEVVRELGELENVNLESVQCGVFPKPKNKSEVISRTKYEGRLKYFRAVLQVYNRNIVIIEADMTNLLIKPRKDKEETTKGASTLILGLKNNANTNFKEIIQNFSDKGAQWSHSYIEERCKLFLPCRHPLLKDKGKVRTDKEYKAKWVDDLKEKLVSINSES